MEPVGALPRHLPRDTPQVTRVSCPDCSGVLTIEAQGEHGHLTLMCRVGHKYSIPDLLVAKEERLEERLWAALHGLQELAELLADLLAYANRQRLIQISKALRQRAKRSTEDGIVLRRIIEENRAVELNDEAAQIRGGSGS
jgi:two-component system chemotaxis response regulator CheB